MDDEVERLLKLNADRIYQLEGTLREVLAHFWVSSVSWIVIYDGEITPEDLRKFVVVTGEVPGFPERDR